MTKPRIGSRRILFLNHSASRNGASILLLNLLHWLHANCGHELEVLSFGGGPLIPDFRAVAPTRVWRDPLFFLRRARSPGVEALRARLHETILRAYLGLRKYDLVYANTAATGSYVSALRAGKRAVLWHIHELPYAIKLTLGDERARRLLRSVDRVIAVSEPVADSLVGEYCVSPERVDLIHGFVVVQDRAPDERLAARRRILQRLGWPDDAFVVGACGGLGWRKGSDLFLQLARMLQRSDAAGTTRFLWVGGSDRNDAEALQFAHDLNTLGLDGVCRRVPSTPDVDDHYCAMDAFALTSREDPFPLVMLEAAMHGLATVCFASSGGGPGFIAEDAGIVVPYLDLGQYAAAIERLRAQPQLRRALGRCGQTKVRERHGIHTQGPKLLSSIERCLAVG